MLRFSDLWCEHFREIYLTQSIWMMSIHGIKKRLMRLYMDFHNQQSEMVVDFLFFLLTFPNKRIYSVYITLNK